MNTFRKVHVVRIVHCFVVSASLLDGDAHFSREA